MSMLDMMARTNQRQERRIRELESELLDMTENASKARSEIVRLDEVATARWQELKAAEKLVRQLTEALKGVLYVAKTETGGVPKHLRADIREAERVLEIVASVRRERRRK